MRITIIATFLMLIVALCPYLARAGLLTSCTGENASVIDDPPFSLSYESWVHPPNPGDIFFRFGRCVISLSHQRARIAWKEPQLLGITSIGIPLAVELPFPTGDHQPLLSDFRYGNGNPLDRDKTVYFVASDEESLFKKQSAVSYENLPSAVSKAQMLIPGDNTHDDVALEASVKSFDEKTNGIRYVIEITQDALNDHEPLRDDLKITINGDVIGPLSVRHDNANITGKTTRIEFHTSAWADESRLALGSIKISDKNADIASFPISYLVPSRINVPTSAPEYHRQEQYDVKLPYGKLKVFPTNYQPKCYVPDAGGQFDVNTAAVTIEYTNGFVEQVPPQLVVQGATDRLCVNLGRVGVAPIGPLFKATTTVIEYSDR